MPPSQKSQAKPYLVSSPRLELHSAQAYLGIRAQVPMKEMRMVIPEFLNEVFPRLDNLQTPPSGPPFIRYLVINRLGLMDIEIGVPVSDADPNNNLAQERVKGGVLPAGRYAVLVFKGPRNGIKGNAELLDWGAENGLVWEHWEVAEGDAFKSRYESYLTDPKIEPKQANWDIEVATTAPQPRINS